MFASRKKLLSMLILASLAVSYSGMAWAESKDIVQNGGKMLYDYAPANKDTNIAIGPGATAVQGKGGQEVMLSVGRPFTDESFFIFTKYSLKDSPDTRAALPASIAVGGGTYARTGSIDVGSKSLPAAVKIGDVKVGNIAGIAGDASTQDRRLGVVSTTLGTNSYTAGAFATTIGGYNIQSSNYDANGRTSPGLAKNAFATVVGALNSNESYSYKSESSGIANAITGVANVVQGSNGALVYGAGNRISHSVEYFSDSTLQGHYDNVTDMQNSLRTAIARSSGGATMAFGGANTAEYTSHSQLMGVGNTMKGSEGNISKYNFMDGFKNSGENLTHVSILGSENTVKNAVNIKLIGDNRLVDAGMTADDPPQAKTAKNSVAFGSVDSDKKEALKISVDNATMLGHNTGVTVEGGVALGAGSLATVDKGAVGFDIAGGDHSADTTGIWKSTAAAVSVGDSAGKTTRQISNVAAGTLDTDAVNVAQLKALSEKLSGLGGSGDSSAPIVYTYQNKIVKKAKDGKFYEADKINKDGTVQAGATAIEGAELSKVETSLLSTDGSTTTAIKLSNVAAGKIEAASKDAINGGQLFDKLKDAGVNSDTPVVTYDSKAMTKVTLGGKDGQSNSARPPVVIDNLADGKIAEGSHEAVTGGQLHTLQTKVENNTGRIDTLSSELGNVKDDVKGTASLGAAMSALHALDYDPLEKNQLMAGLGYYKGISSVALGIAHHENNDFMIHGALAYNTTSKLMFNAGLTWRFGDSSRVDDLKEYETRHRLSDKDLAIALRNRLYRVEEENRAIMAENRQLKADIARIMARLNMK